MNEPSSKQQPENRPRVLHIIPGFESGASWIFAKRQVSSLETEGVVNQVFFLTSRTSPRKMIGEYFRLKRQIASFKPMIVHAHYGKMTALFSLWVTSCPLVITYRGSDLNLERQRLWKTIPGILLSQLVALRARGLICVSKPLGQKLWWRQREVSIVPSGVDLELFRPMPKGEARKVLGWPLQRRVVLFHNREETRVKRIDLARKGLDEAANSVGPIDLEIMDGTLGPEQVPTFMNAADCLLVTSRSEGSPNVVKEALACNLPVISTDVGDVAERLDGVRPSRVVADNPTSIGHALAEILMDGRRSNGREAVKELSLQHMATRVAQVYRNVLSNHQP